MLILSYLLSSLSRETPVIVTPIPRCATVAIALTAKAITLAATKARATESASILSVSYLNWTPLSSPFLQLRGHRPVYIISGEECTRTLKQNGSITG